MRHNKSGNCYENWKIRTVEGFTWSTVEQGMLNGLHEEMEQMLVKVCYIGGDMFWMLFMEFNSRGCSVQTSWLGYRCNSLERIRKIDHSVWMKGLWSKMAVIRGILCANLLIGLIVAQHVKRLIIKVFLPVICMKANFVLKLFI